MEVSTIVTIDTAFLGAFGLLIMFVMYVGNSYIQRDKEWKAADTKKFDEYKKESAQRHEAMMDRLNFFSKDFASKKDVDELFDTARDHEKRLVTVETKRQLFDETCKLCKSSGLGKG